MGKKVSARIKNRIKQHFARSISVLEKSVARGGRFADSPSRTVKKK